MTATEEMITIVNVTEEMTMIVNVTEETITTAIVTEEMTVVGREAIPVAVTTMILFRQEPLVGFRIRALVAARTKVSNLKKETPIMAFP